MAFSFSLPGDLLVRSGVLPPCMPSPRIRSGVSSFSRSWPIVIGGSLALYAWRAPKVGLGGGFAICREKGCVGEQVLLVAAMGSVLLGTLYPLFLDALDLGKISVGPPYFDSVFVPLMVPAIFLMGIGPLANGRRRVCRPWPSVCGGHSGSVWCRPYVTVVLGRWTPLLSLGLLLAIWILTTIRDGPT